MKRISKELIVMEDLVATKEDVTQQRGGTYYTLHGIDIRYPVSSEAKLTDVDIAKFPTARLYSSESEYKEYYYNPNVSDGIPSNYGAGSWQLLVNTNYVKADDAATSEEVILTSGQTEVNFLNTSTLKAVYYKSGNNTDTGRLIAGGDYTVTSESSIRLSQSEPAGTKILAMSTTEDLPGIASDSLKLGGETATEWDAKIANLDAADVGAVAIGQYGIGATASNPAPAYGLDPRAITESGIYRVNTMSGAVNVPAGGNSGSSLIVTIYDTNDKQFLWLDRTGQVYRAYEYNGGWGGWNELYHTGNKPTAADVGAVAVGQFGIGSTDLPDVVGDANTLGVTGSTTYLTSGSTNIPPTEAEGFIHVLANNAGQNSIQLSIQQHTNRLWLRFSNASVFSDWVKFYHTGNLLHLQNVSGATVNSAATVAGSGLNPAKVGTWRNVSGGQILDTGYGLWELI